MFASLLTGQDLYIHGEGFEALAVGMDDRDRGMSSFAHGAVADGAGFPLCTPPMTLPWAPSRNVAVVFILVSRPSLAYILPTIAKFESDYTAAKKAGIHLHTGLGQKWPGTARWTGAGI